MRKIRLMAVAIMMLLLFMATAQAEGYSALGGQSGVKIDSSEVFSWVIAIAIVVAMLAFILIPIYGDIEERRRDVRVKRACIAADIVQAEEMLKWPGVMEQSRRDLEGIQKESSRIEGQFAAHERIDWSEMQKELNRLDNRLTRLIREIEKETDRFDLARHYVLKNQDEIPRLLEATEKLTKHLEVSEENRKTFFELKGQILALDRLADLSGDDWLETYGKRKLLYDRLKKTIYEMEREVSFAQTARREGPALMEKLPDLIQAAERRLAGGNPSPAAAHLEKAKEKYSEARNQQTGMPITDWVILYALLNESMSSVERAELAHISANADHSSFEHSPYEGDHDDGFSDDSFDDGGD